VLRPVDNVIVDAILDVRCWVRNPKETLGVGVVFREQQIRRAFAMQPASGSLRVNQLNDWIGLGINASSFDVV